MRICFISLSAYGYFNPEAYSKSGGGGAQRQLYLIARQLADNYDIHFVVGDYGQTDIEVRNEITLHKSFRPVSSRVKKPLEMIKLFHSMRQADADVYISRYGPKITIASYICSRILGKNWVFNVANDIFVRDFEDIAPILRQMYLHSLQNADGIITQTPYQSQCLRESLGVDSSVVSNGYPRADMRLGYENRDQVLWVGRLDPEQKRPGLFLDLAEKTPTSEFLLIGARGTEQFREQIRNRVSEIDNLDCIFDVPPDEIHQYYQRAIALVSTSAYEGFPNTFLEAWRVGTPVLSLDVDPGRFLEQDGTTDFQAGDLETLSELVLEFDSNEEYWEQVSRTVKHRFEQEYSIDEVANRYIEAIETAVQ